MILTIWMALTAQLRSERYLAAQPFGIKKDCSIAVLFPPFITYFTKVFQT